MNYRQSAAEIAAELGSDIEKGLSIEKAHDRIHSRGRNYIKLSGAKRRFKGLWKHMLSFMNILLILMAAATLAVGEVFVPICFIFCAIINGAVGYINFRRENPAAGTALEGINAPVRVIRSGIEKNISPMLLAQGDVIFLEKGAIVPADAKIISCESLIVDESMVNGESGSALKFQSFSGSDEGVTVLYMGSEIISGSAKAIVTAVGYNTQLGSALGAFREKGEKKSAFAKKIETIGNICSAAATVIWAAALIIRLAGGYGIRSALDNSIAAAITAIPVSLSAVLLITMSLDVFRMRKNGISVGSFSAMEAMGAATVLCAGKRGSLTETGFNVGEVRPGNGLGEEKLRLMGAMCTTEDIDNPAGDAMQAALIRSALENGSTREDIREKAPICKVLDDRSDKGVMTTVHKRENGYTVISKGSPEAVLSCCSYIYDGGIRLINMQTDIAETITSAEAMSAGAMNVIGISFKDVGNLEGDLRSEMIFAGLVGFSNPVRSDAAEAIKSINSMGVKLCVITDDNFSSAKTVAEKCGISSVENGEEALSRGVSKIRRNTVFAGTPVSLKASLTEDINSRRENVAVVGRSAKDAGAMGKGEVSVSTDASAGVCISAGDIHVSGSGLGAVAKLLRECKRSFINNDRIISYLLSCCVAEMICAAAALIMGYSVPFSPAGIMWLNILIGASGAVAIWREPYHRSSSGKRSELARMKNGRLSVGAMAGAGLRGALVGLLTAVMYAVMIEKTGVAEMRMAVFTALSIGFMLMAQSCRSSNPVYTRFGKNKAAWVCAGVQILFTAAVFMSDTLRSLLDMDHSVAAVSVLSGAAAGVCAFLAAEIFKLIRRGGNSGKDKERKA